MSNEATNLAKQIAGKLPSELGEFIRAAGVVAQERGLSLYLVGGVVRDLLLGQTNLDLDLVVEGDAIALAQAVAARCPAKVTVHRRFNTAKVKWDKWSIDFATARAETYPRPGALPVVKPSSLSEDLIRRDFTINAMAVNLTPTHYGELVDLYGGQLDLQQKLIRILHDQSFVDDATRILRGLRYEQRLGFHFDEKTLSLLRRDIPMLDTISADRIRHEMELFLKEPRPEKIFHRAQQLDVLPRIHPALAGDKWLVNKFESARQTSDSASPSPNLYLALLAYRMKPDEVEDFITRLNFPKTAAQVMRDTVAIRAKDANLADEKAARSDIYHLLEGYTLMAAEANVIATGNPVVQRNLQLYLSELRRVKTELNGDSLLRMGVTRGPLVKEMLAQLLEARLDDKVKTRQDEERLVQRLLGG